jgi:hypothetical protein
MLVQMASLNSPNHIYAISYKGDIVKVLSCTALLNVNFFCGPDQDKIFQF